MFRDMIPDEAVKHYTRECEYKDLDILCGLLKEGDRVLEVGCGTGRYITNPLGYLPISITAIDHDVRNIKYARRKNQHKNVEFIHASGESFQSVYEFDLIICSHVLEHVPDPLLMLINMRRLLKIDGILYLGIPNGFGWFEIQNFVPRMLCKIPGGARLVSIMMADSARDSLSVGSQHIQFFTVGGVTRLLEQAGLRVTKQINREILGGAIINRTLLRFPSVARWNVDSADKIPAPLANSWIFICQRK